MTKYLTFQRNRNVLRTMWFGGEKCLGSCSLASNSSNHNCPRLTKVLHNTATASGANTIKVPNRRLYLAEKQDNFVCVWDLMNWVCTSIRLCVCAYPWCCGGAPVIIRRKRLCDYILLAKRDGRGLEIRFYYNNTLVFRSTDAIGKQKCV